MELWKGLPRKSINLNVGDLPPARTKGAPAKVQFEVARNAVTDNTNLGTARLRTWQGRQWKAQFVAGLKLGGCRRAEPIDLGLRRGQRFTVTGGQMPHEVVVSGEMSDLDIDAIRV